MELQDLDPKGSRHLEERLIGGLVDLDLLSLFPLIGGKNHGVIERNPSSKISRAIPLGKKGGFYRTPRNRAVAGKTGDRIFRFKFGPEFPAQAKSVLVVTGYFNRIFPKDRNIRFPENWQKQQNENCNIFFIQTPISMFLGSLESPQWARQEYAEKHHNP